MYIYRKNTLLVKLLFIYIYRKTQSHLGQKEKKKRYSYIQENNTKYPYIGKHSTIYKRNTIYLYIKDTIVLLVYIQRNTTNPRGKIRKEKRYILLYIQEKQTNNIYILLYRKNTYIQRNIKNIYIGKTKPNPGDKRKRKEIFIYIEKCIFLLYIQEKYT